MTIQAEPTRGRRRADEQAPATARTATPPQGTTQPAARTTAKPSPGTTAKPARSATKSTSSTRAESGRAQSARTAKSTSGTAASKTRSAAKPASNARAATRSTAKTTAQPGRSAQSARTSAKPSSSTKSASSAARTAQPSARPAARPAKRTAVKKGAAASVAAKVAKAATALVEPPPRPSRSVAAERAYARRAHREGRKVERVVEADIDRASSGRASFVVLIIAVMAVGVAATLWLSTQAIADSYRLDAAKKEAEQLAEQAAQLQREVTEQESAASLAERAKAMGMIPAGDPARLVVRPDGTVVLVGDPTPVLPPPPPTGQQPPATPPAGTAPGAGG